jgi:MazG family protein
MNDISELVEIMARLRDPQTGCPWDREQDFHSIAPYTIEEAYEVADAIERRNMEDLCEELGDLLFQVVYHARLAQELGVFDLKRVTAGICEKLVRRHPHVFAPDGAAHQVGDARAQTVAWDQHKAREKQARGQAQFSILADIPIGLPALTRAAKLGRRASKAGFDWPDARGPRDKITEELEELDQEICSGDRQRMHHEAGDLLFAVVNLCRHLDLDPEAALRDSNDRFRRRFQYLEDVLAREGSNPASSSLQRMDELWEQAKGSGA